MARYEISLIVGNEYRLIVDAATVGDAGRIALEWDTDTANLPSGIIEAIEEDVTRVITDNGDAVTAESLYVGAEVSFELTGTVVSDVITLDNYATYAQRYELHTAPLPCVAVETSDESTYIVGLGGLSWTE